MPIDTQTRAALLALATVALNLHKRIYSIEARQLDPKATAGFTEQLSALQGDTDEFAAAFEELLGEVKK